VQPRRRIAVRQRAPFYLALGLFVVVGLVPWAGTASPAAPPAGAPHPFSLPPGTPTRSYALSTVSYSSSVDGFSLSYSEMLPAGYVSSQSYPLAVELHGISSTETTPMSGGYPTATPTTTLDAASAAGLILLFPNTRTGVGFYTDSPYTGPQAQDILDAIAHEQGRRLISATYLYGFSMGAMGAMSIGLAHPTMFAGLGAIATFSDLYETTYFQYTHNQSGLPNLLVDVAGGQLPNGSAFSRHVFDDLSQLRFHPERTSGLRVYLASGGDDSAATNNPNFWPYEQGNDSVLQTTCLTIAAYDEASNCTRPLAVLHALDPANFTYRYVFEPNGPHDYALLNATDLFRYFLGGAPAGTYYGLFPYPRAVPPPVPLVTLATEPSNCGTIVVDGTPYPNGVTLQLVLGNHSVAFDACPGTALAAVRTSGGVAYDGPAGVLVVNASGAVVATFSPPIFHVLASASVLCDAVSLNGSLLPNGTVANELGGSYALEAGACPPFAFTSWATTGGVRVADAASTSTVLTVSGNGSVEAVYMLPPPPPGSARVYVYVAPAECGPVVVDGVYVANGSFADLTLGAHAATAPSCSAHDFVDWTFGGGVTTAVGPGSGASNVNLSVTADGTLTAIYAPRTPNAYDVEVTVVPAACGRAVVLDNASYGNGTVALLTSGIHQLAAGSCPAFDFHAWTVAGDLAVTSDSVTVSGNGSLTATFTPSVAPPPNDGNNTSAEAAAPWTSSPYLWGPVGVVGGLAIGAAVAARWRRPPAEPDEPPGS